MDPIFCSWLQMPMLPLGQPQSLPRCAPGWALGEAQHSPLLTFSKPSKPASMLQTQSHVPLRFCCLIIVLWDKHCRYCCATLYPRKWSLRRVTWEAQCHRFGSRWQSGGLDLICFCDVSGPRSVPLTMLSLKPMHWSLGTVILWDICFGVKNKDCLKRSSITEDFLALESGQFITNGMSQKVVRCWDTVGASRMQPRSKNHITQLISIFSLRVTTRRQVLETHKWGRSQNEEHTTNIIMIIWKY